MAKKKKAATVKNKKAAKPKKAAKKAKGLPPVTAGIPCICIERRGRWFCMKQNPDDGSLERCDGPFATKGECEEHVCLD